MQETPEPGARHTPLWRPVAGLAIDYLRWTQLVPMVMAWAFLLLMVAALLLTNFQQQSFGLIEWSITTYERLFGPIDGAPPAASRSPQGAGQPTDDGAVHFSEDDIRPWVMKAWAVLALAGWLLGMLRAWLFGPREPMTLKRKLAWAALGAAACSALCLLAWRFGSETFHGSPIGWIALFVGAPALVWAVSAWGLSISHLLDLVRRRVESGPSASHQKLPGANSAGR